MCFSSVWSAALASFVQDDRALWAQAPLAIAILAAPMACFALFAVSLRSSISQDRRRRFRMAVGLVPLAALGFYALYETGVSPETNIRVDLLLIYPALLLAFISWPALHIAAVLLQRRK